MEQQAGWMGAEILVMELQADWMRSVMFEVKP